MFSGAEAKRKILEMFEKKGEQPVVKIDFLYISADLQHDPAFVQHVNDKLITPWLKANGVNDEATFKIHLVDSDDPLPRARLHLACRPQALKHAALKAR